VADRPAEIGFPFPGWNQRSNTDIETQRPCHIAASVLLQPMSWLAPVATISLLAESASATEREVSYWHKGNRQKSWLTVGLLG
jgi:hypothetical protein